jgi:predicted dienelactone hydrolase
MNHPAVSTHLISGWRRSGLTGLAALSSLALSATTGLAAEEVYIDYSLLSRSVPTASLAAYAETGEADEALSPYLDFLDSEQQEDLRTALTASREVELVPLTQWFYTPMGANVLLFAGNLIRTDAGLNGQQALRSSFIASASEDGSISLLDLIENFPTPGLRLDLDQLLTVIRQSRAEAEETMAIVSAVAQQSAVNAAQPPALDLATLPDLTQPGPYPTRQVSLTLRDAARDNRTYPVDVFLPDNLAAVEGTLPVIVISHGLGDSRTSFLADAEQIATYGFAVAVPEHIGSNAAQKQAMKEGLSNETFKAEDFLDRPLDITFLLDELERTNASQYQNKLDLDQVAVIGHSFGGYTALALAGATIDFDLLAEECTPEFNILLNAAQLLECRALELQDDPDTMRQLAVDGVGDSRVKLVMPFAPVSYLFGESGMAKIQIPVAITGGAYDIVARVVPEQIDTFGWLTTPEKYLYLLENTSHGPSITRTINLLFYPDQDFEQGVDEGLALTRGTSQALAVAFARVYLEGDTAYEPFLSSAYVEAVSEEPFKRYLVRELPATW